MKNIPLLIGTLVGTLLLVIVVAMLFGQNTTPEVIDEAKLVEGARHRIVLGEQTATESATSQQEVKTATDAASEPSTPSAQPAVTVVEFSDFQCPACKAAEPIGDVIETQFPGKVTFIYRHFPLITIHKNALVAAQAAEAASLSGKFWPMHDKLFETQEEWSELSEDEAKGRFIGFAEELGIEKDLFTEQINSDTVKSMVQSDINLSSELKIDSTPTFFVNGKKVPASEVVPSITELLGQ